MRLSMSCISTLAVLVGLTLLPSARAQSSGTSADRLPRNQRATDTPIQFEFSLDGSQDPSARSGVDRSSDAARVDRQVEAEVRLAERGFQSQHQEYRYDPLKPFDAWVQSNQGANPGTIGFSKDGQTLLWLAHPQDGSSGMSLVAVDEALRSHLKLAKDRGLLVTAIDPQSPAAQAGVQQNDVLLKLGDSWLSKPEDFDAALKDVGIKSGGRPWVVVLHVVRDGKAREIQVQPQIHVSFGPVKVEPLSPEFWIGVSVADVEPALRAQLRIPADKGLLINEVFKESPAHTAGLKVNDILLSLNGKPLTAQKTLVDLVQANGGKPISLGLMREGKLVENVEVVPQRRKLTQVSDPTKKAFSYRWEVVRPGALFNQFQPYHLQFRDVTPLARVGAKLKNQQPNDANAALEKRLDEMHAEIEKTLKLIAEVNEVLKANEDLKRAKELLDKASAGKK